MKLTVLGCDGAHPAPGGACSGYLLETEKETLIVDLGTGCLPYLMEKSDPKDWSALLLSHLHGDHMSDVLTLKYVLQMQKAAGRLAPDFRLPVYLPQSPAAEFSVVSDCPHFDIRPITDGMEAIVGGAKVTFMQGRHPYESFGLRIEADGKRFAYTGDTNTCAMLDRIFENADLALADGAFLKEKWNENLPHASAHLCAKAARAQGAKALIVTHIMPGGDREAIEREAAAEFPGALAAHRGMTVTL